MDLGYHGITAESVHEHRNYSNLKIRRVFNARAPVKVKMSSGKERARWRNASAVADQKRECRRAERKWRKIRLRSDYGIFKERICMNNAELNGARRSHFSNIINRNINKTRALSATVVWLINPPALLPPEYLSLKECNLLLLMV